jgi:hypothetical protein
MSESTESKNEKILCPGTYQGRTCSWPICFEIDDSLYECKYRGRYKSESREYRAQVIVGKIWCPRCRYELNLPLSSGGTTKEE